MTCSAPARAAAARHVLHRAGAGQRARCRSTSAIRARALLPLGPGDMELDRPKRALPVDEPDGVGEHGDGGARLQRHHRQDAGRQASRRAAADDVHGRVPAGRRSRTPTTIRSRSRLLLEGEVEVVADGARSLRRATCSGRASAASTRSNEPRQHVAGSRRPPGPARPVTRTASSATGTTSRSAFG